VGRACHCEKRITIERELQLCELGNNFNNFPKNGDRTSLPGGGTMTLGGGTMTLGGGTAISGGGTPDRWQNAVPAEFKH